MVLALVVVVVVMVVVCGSVLEGFRSGNTPFENGVGDVQNT